MIWQYIIDNQKWIFSGIGGTIVAILAAAFFKKDATANEKVSNNATTSINVVTNVTGLADHKSATEKTQQEINPKYTKHILFIDDDTKFKIVSILKKMGWNNVQIVKDISSLNSSEVLKADLIFVDIQGVGLKLGFNDQGLGLVKALKETHPKKKVVIYSAVNEYHAFQEGFRRADDRLSKNAEPYEFEKVITELLQ